MTTLLARKILLSLAALHTTYTAIILGLYIDLTERMTSPVMRILWTTALCTIGLFAYRAASDPNTIWEILPLQSTTAKNYINTQIMPLVAESIRLIGATAILASIIDKLLYLVGHWRMPYLITLLLTCSGAFVAGITIYRMLIGPKEAATHLLELFRTAVPLITEPLLGMLLFLLVALIGQGLRGTLQAGWKHFKGADAAQAPK